VSVAAPEVSPANCAQEHLLEVEGLCVTYGRTPALRQVTFEARCGESLALIGPNGAGKTTLLKALAGLVAPDHGAMRWRGDLLATRRREIAYLPQRSEVDWNFPATVRRVVEMGRYPHLGWWRAFGRRDRDAVDRAIGRMGLGDLQGRQISALSGGQQQRTFLARALAQEAHVLLLDEPFAGLDASASAALAGAFHALTAAGHLVIASHHDLGSAPSVFDRALVLRCSVLAHGRCAECLTPELREAAFGSPATPAGPASPA
jgi:ABC-type Mn2+/Zn2+ transport system ATPase subunit